MGVRKVPTILRPVHRRLCILLLATIPILCSHNIQDNLGEELTAVIQIASLSLTPYKLNFTQNVSPFQQSSKLAVEMFNLPPRLMVTLSRWFNDNALRCARRTIHSGLRRVARGRARVDGAHWRGRVQQPSKGLLLAPGAARIAFKIFRSFSIATVEQLVLDSCSPGWITLAGNHTPGKKL